MPKLKTHKGAQARYQVTGSGRIMRRKRMSSHNRLKKPKKVRRQFGSRKLPVSAADAHRVRRLLPYAF